MGLTEERMQLDGGRNDMDLPTMNSQNLNISTCGIDKDAYLLYCRVCHCAESDRRGDAALSFLDISPPSHELLEIDNAGDSSVKVTRKLPEKDNTRPENAEKNPAFLEFISPEGEIFICSTDTESGSCDYQDILIDLGCSCKNDLALAHYACALKWFVSHGSTVCEICGAVAKNIRIEDFRKVVASLKDNEALRERTATGEVAHLRLEANTRADPDAIAAIRRQRLSEISLWFNPHSTSITMPQEPVEQLSFSSNNSPTRNVVAIENPLTKQDVGGIVILVTMGLLMITIAWFTATHVGKNVAKIGLHVLLGVICALTVLIFLRFVVPRIKYGPARYWAMSFILCFLVFGVWASRTHDIRST
ncbi:uncharacterized protein [Typha angustifolia]|uniref:uncharacterized protein isoform X1 n=1 Tax=Typha angustifolia TaxID=59011 RepID=UPI003C2DF38E